MAILSVSILLFCQPHLIFWFVLFFSLFVCSSLFYFLVAGLGPYALLSEWEYPRYLSILGRCYTLGGTSVSLTNLLNHFQTGVWVLWLVLAWERMLRSQSSSSFLCFTLGSANQFLAGLPEIFPVSISLVLIDSFRFRSAGCGSSSSMSRFPSKWV